MGQISAKLRRTESGHTYWCQGCEDTHHVTDAWGFNGNAEKPTFTPSVLVRSGHFAPGHEGKSCWCTYNAQHPERTPVFHCHRCHTFVRDGMVEFLSDCSHALAGQTLPLPDLPEHLRDSPAT